MLEIERTYLLKFLPQDLDSYQNTKMSDLYIPSNSPHPQIRLRQNGNYLVLTKKYPKNTGDNTVMVEENIELSQLEYDAFRKMDGLLTQKTRYKKMHTTRICEIDIFEENLQGYATADFEFNNEEDAKSFIAPDYCGLEITHIEGLAGGMIAGKTHQEVQEIINKQINR